MTVPPLPPDRPACFRATVHGTVFGGRSAYLRDLNPGDALLLIPGPPTDDDPGVWVHIATGDVIGHLPPEIELWLSPWLLRGGKASARVMRVEGEDVPSWRRLMVEVTCG